MTYKGRRAIGDGQSTPSSPKWVLRHHAPSPIHHLRLIKPEGGHGKDLLLAAGDGSGRFSLTSLRDYRPRHFWQAHKESILGVDVMELDRQNVMISSGRDNKLRAFLVSSLRSLTSATLPSRMQEELPIPKEVHTLDINALNYCPFSAFQSTEKGEDKVTVAVPHTIDSGFIDMYDLSSGKRIASAVGKPDMETKGVKTSRAAMVMAIELLSTKNGIKRLISGYEDGFVKLWTVDVSGVSTLNWSVRNHSESVMAIAVSKDQSFCVSVAADRQVALYDVGGEGKCISTESNSMGHATVAIRGDGQMIAVGGWDGCIRLYDRKLQQLASLRYHKDTVQALSFVQTRTLAHATKDEQVEESVDSDSGIEDSGREHGQQQVFENLLVSGGKEGRICLWST